MQGLQLGHLEELRGRWKVENEMRVDVKKDAI